MKTVKEVFLAVSGIFFIGLTVVILLCLAVALSPLLQEGFWPGVGGLLVCLGALLVGIGIAAQIARTPRPSQNRFLDTVVPLIFSDPIAFVGLVVLASCYSVLLGGAIFVCWMPFAVRMLQQLFQVLEDESDNSRRERLIGNSRERGVCAYRD